MENATLENWMENPVGTIDAPRLTAKECQVVSVNKQTVTKRDKTGTLDKIVFNLKHPDKTETIEMSDVCFIDGKEVKQKCMWLFLDSQAQIQKGSALAVALSFYGAKTVKEMIGKTVKTAIDEKGYLVMKAY